MLEKVIKRLRRKARVRAKISGSSDIPRLNIYRSNSNIYSQIIDDTNGITICSVSDLKMEKTWTKTEMAKKVWIEIAKKAQEKWIKKVVFDRSWFLFQGRVKSLADWAREWGLDF